MTNTKHVQLAEQPASALAGTTTTMVALDDVAIDIEASRQATVQADAPKRKASRSGCWFVVAVTVVIVGAAVGLFYYIKPEWRCFILMQSPCPALEKALAGPTAAPTPPATPTPPRNPTNGTSSTTPIIGCAAGFTDCGGTCRDLRDDAGHCGTCGRGCAAGETCRDGACQTPAPTSAATTDPTPFPTAAPERALAARGVAYVWVARDDAGNALASGDAGAIATFEAAFAAALEGLITGGGGGGGLRRLDAAGPAVAPNAVVVPAPADLSGLFAGGRAALRVVALAAEADPNDKAAVAARATYELGAHPKAAGLHAGVSKAAAAARAALARDLDAAAHALNGKTPEQFRAACAAALKPKGFLVTRAYSAGTARAGGGGGGGRAPPPTRAPTRPPSPAVVPLTPGPTPATQPPSPATTAATTPSPTPFSGFIGGGLPNKLAGSCGFSPGCVAKRGGVVYVAGTGVEPCHSCSCNAGFAKRMRSDLRTRNLHHYCARVPTGAPTPAPTPFPTPPQPQVLRVRSASHYALIDVQVPTGTQLVPPGGTSGIPARGVHDVALGAAGLASVPVTMGAGHYEPGGAKTVYWTWTQNVLLQSGGVTTFEPADPTVHTLLTRWQPARTYSGQFWVGTVPHTAAFRFTSGGGWTLYTDGQQTGSGQVSLVSWPDYSMIIQWTIEPGNNDRKVLWAFPWGCFKMRNGPQSWPIIEYCA